MSLSRTYIPRYFLKSGNHMSLSVKGTETDCFDVLGFHQGLPVIQAQAQTNNPTPTIRRVMEEEGSSSKLFGKRVILSGKNLSRKVIIINAKNIQIPLTQCTPLKVNQEMLRRALQFPSANESLEDYTYQEGQDNVESLSRRRGDKKNSIELSTGIACSDFQEFEAKFYREIAHKDSVLTHRINSSGGEVEATRIVPEFDEPEFVHIPHKVYGRQRKNNNAVASNCDGGNPEENNASNNNRSKAVHVMGKIKHFKEKNSQESQPKLISSSAPSEAVSEASTSKARRKKKMTLQMSSKRLLIRREIERCLMQQRRLKKPVKIRSVSTQTSSSEVNSDSTQTDQDMFAIDEPFINHLLEDDLFIRDNGHDTNFGQGPIMAPIKHIEIKNGPLLDISGKLAAMDSEAFKYDDGFGVNGQIEQEKLIFFRCLNNCTEVKTMGNLNIHLAVCQNDVAEVQRQCLALRVRQRSVDAFNDNDMTPLHLAVINDCLPQIVHLLLKFGADITLTDQDGNNPLHLAVTAGAEGILEMLLSVARQKNFKVDLYNFEGFTPLMLATLESNIPITRMLLDSKASPNLRDQKSGRTPLFHAVESNNTELVRLLLRYKANTRISNFFGTSTHEAIFELDNINQEIKSMVIGKDLFQNRNKTGEKRRRAPAARKEKPPSAVKKPKLKIVKMLKKVVT